MHLNITSFGDINENVDVTYHTLNVKADNERYMYFIGDPPHLTKTAYNCLTNSLAWRCARIMWNEKHFDVKLFRDCLLIIYFVVCT